MLQSPLDDVKRTLRHVCGGVGDMLLSLESAIAHKTIDVFSHFKNAPSFYRPFGVRVNRFQYFASVGELCSLGIQSEALPRSKYPRFNLPKAPIEPPNGGPVIGIHVEGSKFSNEACKETGRPIKDMSPRFLKNLAAALRPMNALPYVFCSPSRLPAVKSLFGAHYERPFRVIAYGDIWASLACVAHCQAVLATDSAIKTMAAILKIPTVVLAADYSDPFRDEVFLKPYAIDGIMRVICFKEIDAIDPRETLKVLRELSKSTERGLEHQFVDT